MINTKNTLRFYSKIYDPLFKKKYTVKSDRSVPAIEVLNKYLEKHPTKIHHVIDVGCAWGKTLKYWSKQNIKVVGVDVSKIAVKHCQKKGYDCHWASATDLSIFDDKSFDFYMSTDVYEHLRTDDLECAISEAIRVIRCGGIILIRPHLTLDKRKTLHLTVWDIDKWADFFVSYGLEHIEVNGLDKYYKNCFLMKTGN